MVMGGGGGGSGGGEALDEPVELDAVGGRGERVGRVDVGGGGGDGGGGRLERGEEDAIACVVLVHKRVGDGALLAPLKTSNTALSLLEKQTIFSKVYFLFLLVDFCSAENADNMCVLNFEVKLTWPSSAI